MLPPGHRLLHGLSASFEAASAEGWNVKPSQQRAGADADGFGGLITLLELTQLSNFGLHCGAVTETNRRRFFAVRLVRASLAPNARPL